MEPSVLLKRMIQHELRGFKQCSVLLSAYDSLYQNTVNTPMTSFILCACALVFATLVRLFHILGPIKSGTGMVVFGGVFGMAFFVIKMASRMCLTSARFRNIQLLLTRKSLLYKKVRSLGPLKIKVGSTFKFEQNILLYWHIIALRTADLLILLM